MSKPPVNPKINLEDFIRERDAAIATGDLLEMARFYQKHNPKFDNPELKQEAKRKKPHQGPPFTKEDNDAPEAQVRPEAGTGSNPDDPAGPQPEQPVVDVAIVTGSSGETPTG